MSDRERTERNVPSHVAFIMDGNGRWAKKLGLPRVFGHREGVKAIERVVRFGLEKGIRYLSFYAFSTENWKRPVEEIEGLMKLFRQQIADKSEELAKQGVRLRFSGRIGEFPEDFQKLVERAERTTETSDRMHVIVCMNYGGRQEILDAFEKALREGTSGLDEKSFRSYLYLADVPDPDLVVRTSGEMRLSNFLLWQSSYAELYFTDILWPDFSEKDFEKAIKAYTKRTRRYGSVENSES
ncbi:MAG: polyprenyl diphosphate synthase [Thermovirgaceae bacterium]